MATKNRLWGAERIRGELQKLGIHVCKRTIQKYIKHVRAPQPEGQKWATDLAQSRCTDLGLRLLTGNRSLLSTALCVRHHRTQIEARNPRGSDTISHRSLGCATASRSHAVWVSTEVSDS
jgi:hypothetical protein